MELNNKQNREQIEEAESLPMLLLEATDYLRLFYQEQSLPKPQLQERLVEIYREYRQSHTYWQTEDELIYGAKAAWRNSTRCIEHMCWDSLIVRDLRHLTTPAEIFAAIVEHIQQATNSGSIRSTISIFAPDSPSRPGIRIWNPLLIRYAGYRADGSIVGDPAQTKLTKCQQLGWQGQETSFDVLPLIIQMPGQPPQWFELPPEVVMEVPLTHPDYDWFAELNLKWHALPAVSNWRLEVGGISYSCASFNGWYMSAEIDVRNFVDVKHHNLLLVIAQRLGLNTRSKLSLWQDRALIELSQAVVHSFATRGITIIDHHTASVQFMRYWQREAEVEQIVPADWGRIASPLSASIMEALHQEVQNCLSPDFFSQPEPWKS